MHAQIFILLVSYLHRSMPCRESPTTTTGAPTPQRRSKRQRRADVRFATAKWVPRAPVSGSLPPLHAAVFFRSVRADRLLTPCLPERDGRRVSRLEMGLVANQACSPEDGGEHKNPAKQFEMVGFPVSPPVNPKPACGPCRIPDSSRIYTG
jgi:hypothetical protein